MNERHEVDNRGEASNKFKVSEWKVRTVQKIGNMTRSPISQHDRQGK